MVVLVAAMLGAGACSRAPERPPAACDAASRAGEPGPQTTSEAVLVAAALSHATVVVDPVNSRSARCIVLASGNTAHLDIGDRAEFEANGPPRLSPPGSDVVHVSTGAGRTTRLGGLATTHVIVTLTAAAPGTVTAQWIDCSGTGC